MGRSLFINMRPVCPVYRHSLTAKLYVYIYIYVCYIYEYIDNILVQQKCSRIIIGAHTHTHGGLVKILHLVLDTPEECNDKQRIVAHQNEGTLHSYDITLLPLKTPTLHQFFYINWHSSVQPPTCRNQTNWKDLGSFSSTTNSEQFKSNQCRLSQPFCQWLEPGTSARLEPSSEYAWQCHWSAQWCGYSACILALPLDIDSVNQCHKPVHACSDLLYLQVSEKTQSVNQLNSVNQTWCSVQVGIFSEPTSKTSVHQST